MVKGTPTRLRNLGLFQYSLCRVVLMVWKTPTSAGLSTRFQYSLCRVVLMVLALEMRYNSQI